MLIRIILICLALAPSFSQAKQLSHTFKTDYKNFKVVKGYDDFSKQGKVSLKTCPTCLDKVFILNNKTILAENGFNKPIEDLLKITLSNKAKHVLLQVNKYTNTVFYIEWGYPEGEKEGQE